MLMFFPGWQHCEETGYTPTQEALSDGGRGPHFQGIQSSVFKPHHHLVSMKHASLSLTVSASGSKDDQRRSKSHLRYSCRMVASLSETGTHFQHQ
jgi:hypothetical protein